MANYILELLVRLINPLRFLYLAERLQFGLMTHPCCARSFFEQHINIRPTPPSEIQTYSHFCKDSRHFMLVIVSLFAIYAVKNVVYLHYTLAKLDFGQPINNLKLVNDVDQKNNSIGAQYQFLCLRTNCSSLIGNSNLSGLEFTLPDDLLGLPIFSICNQQLKWLFTPLIRSQDFGLLYMAEFTFMVVVMCCLLQAHLYLAEPIQHKPMMFVLCPISTLNMMRADIRRLLVKLHVSELNYFAAQSRRSKGGQILASSSSSSSLGFGLCRRRLPANARPTLDRLRAIEAEDDHLWIKYVDDCLPISRTEWWRLNWSRGYVFVLVASLVFWFQVFGSMLALLYYYSCVSHQEALEKLDFARRAHCNLWLWTDNGDGDSAVQELTETHLRLEWNFYTLAELLVTSFVPIYIIAITVCNFMFVWHDQKVWILELAEQLSLAGTCLALTRTGACQQDQHTRGFEMAHIRRRLIDKIDFSWSVLLERRPVGGPSWTSKLDRKRADQQFARSLMASEANDECQLLEKTYINFEHFKAYLAANDWPIMNVLLFNGLLNYGHAVIAVYFYRNFTGFLVAPIFQVVISLVVMNNFISLASDLHGSLRKLQPLIWTIISEMEKRQVDGHHRWDDDDEGDHQQRVWRLRHLRSLWLKQVVLVDESGGLAHRFFGLHITYVAVIKMLLWTSTILLVALQRH